MRGPWPAGERVNDVDPVEDVRAAFSSLAQALFDVENSPDLVFVRSQADAGAPAAVAVVDELAVLWERYPDAGGAVERLEAAAAADDRQEVGRLLRADHGPAAGGKKLGLRTLLADLHRRAAKVGTECARLAAAAREALSLLDGATTALAALQDQARAVGAGDDPELAAAAAALSAATAAVAADPVVGAPAAEVERALDNARHRVEALEERRRELPAALAAAERQLAEIRRLVAEGAHAMERARTRIAGAGGLLEPLDPAAVDVGERALAPWLDRIRTQAAGGGWRPAGEGLDRWRAVADGWLANARTVADANAAPVRRRNELRGLLDAYRAKAMARGAAENARLDPLHRAARDALYGAPCDLVAAEAAVRRYVDAVNASSGAAR